MKNTTVKGAASQPASPLPGPGDDAIVAALEAEGVDFLRFLGGAGGKTEIYTTSGSQEVAKIVLGVRRLLNEAIAPIVDDRDRLMARCVAQAGALAALQKLDFQLRVEGGDGLPAGACKIIDGCVT